MARARFNIRSFVSTTRSTAGQARLGSCIGQKLDFSPGTLYGGRRRHEFGWDGCVIAVQTVEQFVVDIMMLIDITS
jgi:hypothetical protein